MPSRLQALMELTKETLTHETIIGLWSQKQIYTYGNNIILYKRYSGLKSKSVRRMNTNL